jgi:hypothetical protein
LEKEIMHRVLMSAAAGVLCISGQAVLSIVPAQAATPDLQGILGTGIFSWFRSASHGRWPRDTQETGYRFCRRLHQSNLEAAGGRNREKAWGP